ncbi:MAG: energy transducer TonB [Phycisphaerae bacterium]|nr:energy transducer TonB [Saprospiraceae bacterium]
MLFKTAFLLLFSLFFSTLSAQTDPPKAPEEKTFEMFDLQKTPTFPGGESAMMQYLAANIKYPALARENGIQGTVALTFIVGKDGSVTDVKIIKDIGGGCGKESVRVVEAMPKWTPGQANGQPVKVRYTMPIRFKFEDDSPPPLPDNTLEPVTRDGMWELVSEAAQRTYNSKTPITRNSPYSFNNLNDKKLLMILEMAFEIKLADGDRKDFETMGPLSDYFYKAQFAPQFFTEAGFGGKSAKILTHRADFDANADGLGKIGSLIVPKGIRVVLFSKKGFKGKKLEINAKEAEIEIPDLSSIQSTKGKIKNGGKDVHWGVNTQSAKIILPIDFPDGY